MELVFVVGAYVWPAMALETLFCHLRRTVRPPPTP